jgi:ribosomal protein L29
MADSEKRVESISELIDELDDLRERLFHIQKSLEKMEETARVKQKK